MNDFRAVGIYCLSNILAGAGTVRPVSAPGDATGIRPGGRPSRQVGARPRPRRYATGPPRPSARFDMDGTPLSECKAQPERQTHRISCTLLPDAVRDQDRATHHTPTTSPPTALLSVRTPIVLSAKHFRIRALDAHGPRNTPVERKNESRMMGCRANSGLAHSL